MYVLKLGSNAITNNTKIMECNNCGSRLIYNQYDVGFAYDIDGGDAMRYIRCPVCGEYIELEKEKDALATAFSNLLGLNLNND